MKLQLRAAIYVRVNTPEDAEQRLAEQEQRIREWAEPHYLDIVQVYAEIGSGAKEDRPVWLELLAAAEAGEFEILLITDYTRLFRGVALVRKYRELLYNEYDVSVIAVNSPPDNLEG